MFEHFHVRDDHSISELILSGGDPLSLSTAKLAELTAALSGMPHIRRLRIHTRLPVVLPERIDAEFRDWLSGLPLQRVVVVHANHPREIDASVAIACKALRDAGATVLNQSVLLRGINDDADTLAALSERLFDAGVLPYYLHQLDRVAGTAHFEVTDDAALGLMVFLASFYGRPDGRTRCRAAHATRIWGCSRISEAYPFRASADVSTASDAAGSP